MSVFFKEKSYTFRECLRAVTCQTIERDNASYDWASSSQYLLTRKMFSNNKVVFTKNLSELVCIFANASGQL